MVHKQAYLVVVIVGADPLLGSLVSVTPIMFEHHSAVKGCGSIRTHAPICLQQSLEWDVIAAAATLLLIPFVRCVYLAIRPPTVVALHPPFMAGMYVGLIQT